MADVPPELSAEIRTLEQKHSENPAGRFFVPLANAYRKAGELGQAEQLLREGLRRHPDYLSAHIVLGRCFADRGATRPAVDEFRHVLGIDPQNLIALRTLGELAAGEGEQAQAEYWFRELLAVDPLNDEAREMLDALRPAPPPPPNDLPAFGAPAGYLDPGGEAAAEDDQAWEEDPAWWELQPEEAPAENAAPVPDPATPTLSLPVGEDDGNFEKDDRYAEDDVEYGEKDDRYGAGDDSAFPPEDDEPAFSLEAAGLAVPLGGDEPTLFLEEDEPVFPPIEDEPPSPLDEDHSDVEAPGAPPSSASGWPMPGDEHPPRGGGAAAPAGPQEAPGPEPSGPDAELPLQEAAPPAPAGDALGASPPLPAEASREASEVAAEPAAAAATGAPRTDPDAGYDAAATDRGGQATAGDDLMIDEDDDAYDRVPGFGDAAVVTETVAELYARQGFYDRAADVYRKLLAGRGDDDRLQKRLAEVVAQEDAARLAAAPPPHIEKESDTAGAPAAKFPGLNADAELFITSLSGMFDGERVWELQAAPPADDERGAAAASTETAARDEAVAVASRPSIREYLAGLLDWRPGSVAGVERSRAREEPEEPQERDDDQEDEDEGLRAAAPEEAPAPAPAAAANEAEEDLESFQAWLRSLKR